MKILEISFGNVEKDKAVGTLIRSKAKKLEQVCLDFIECRFAILGGLAVLTAGVAHV